MIPNFKTYINESIWGDIRKKSLGQEAREENILESELLKMKKMEFIDMSSSMYSGKKILWAPCNFGSERFDEPGMWFDTNKMFELNELLAGTEYHMAIDWDWKHLITCTCTVETIKDKTYSLVLKRGSNKLYVPIFGYMSPPGIKPLFTRKTDNAIYGGVAHNMHAYFYLRRKDGVFNVEDHYLPKDGTEMHQVRLVKEIS